MVSQQSTEGGGGSPAACRHRRVSSPGQVRPGLLHQGKLGQGQPEREAWHGAGGGLQDRVGKVMCQDCSHEQAGSWMRWESVTWQDNMELKGHLIKFCCVLCMMSCRRHQTSTHGGWQRAPAARSAQP